MNRKLIRIIVLAILLLIGKHGLAQFEQNYFTQENGGDFNLPTISLAITMKPGMGVGVPKTETYQAFIDSKEGEISYFFNYDLITDEQAEFHFYEYDTKSGEMKSGEMKLMFYKYSDEYNKQISDAIKSSQYYEKELSALKTNIGNFKRYKYKGEVESMIYLGTFNELGVVFFVNTNNSKDFDKWETMIKSLRENKMPEALENYQIRVMQGEFDSKERVEFSMPDREMDNEADSTEVETEAYSGNNEEPLSNFEGKLDNATSVSFSGLGFNLSLPAGYTYQFDARDVTEENNHIEVVLYDNDLNNNSPVSMNFNNDKLYMIHQITKVMTDTKDLIEQDKLSQKAIKEFQIVIDGVVFDAVALGPEEFPTINAHGQLNGYAVNLSFIMVEKSSFATVEKFLNDITFSDEQKEGLPKADTNIDPISKQLTIKDQIIEPLNKITFAKPKKAKGKLVTYDFDDEGVSCKLPEGIYETANPEDGLETKSPTHKLIKGSMDNNKFLSISTSSRNLDEQFFVSIIPMSSRFLESADMMIKSCAAYTSNNLIRTGIGNVNGSDWVLIEYEQTDSHVFIFMTEYNGNMVILMCNINNKKKPDISKYEGLLYYFSLPTISTM